MEDKHTPMEAAEVLEVPSKEKPLKVKQPDGYYGTAIPEVKKKNYTGLLILLCLVIVLIGSSIVFLKFMQIRFETVDGKLALTLGERTTEQNAPTSSAEPVNLTPNATYEVTHGSTPDNSDFSLSIHSSGEEGPKYSAGELYAMVNPSVVCVLTEGFSSAVAGTGIIMSQDGYIVTNEDLLKDAATVTVIFSDSSSLSATIIGSDSSTGIAVIKVAADKELTPAQFASPDELSIGDAVISISNPYGSQIRNVLSQGLVSAISTEATVSGVPMTLIKTTAGLDSNGCPIINDNGQIVAITTNVGTQLTDDGSDPHLAISIVSVEKIMEELVETGYMAASGWLGFEVEEIPAPYLSYYNYPGSLWIAGIGADTIAGELLQQWDVIIEVDGKAVATIDDFNAAISRHSIGESVQLTIYRAKRLYLATLPLTHR